MDLSLSCLSASYPVFGIQKCAQPGGLFAARVSADGWNSSIISYGGKADDKDSH